MRNKITGIFTELDQAVELENRKRFKEGTRTLLKSRIILFGQMSLMLNESVCENLTLVQTSDMDAKLEMDHFTKTKLVSLLNDAGLVYDEDSPLVRIPEDAKLIHLLKLKHVEVDLVDAESVLVSKAVYAPDKNRQLVRQAIASGHFPGLVDRIVLNGGNLDLILEDDHG